MLHIIGGRQTGKTSRLIAHAIANNCDILVPTRIMAQAAAETARRMGLEVSKDPKRNLFKIENIYILTQDYSLLYGETAKIHTERGVLIDEVDIFLNSLVPNLKGYTVTEDEEIALGNRMFLKKPIINVPENDDQDIYFKCPRCGEVHNKIDVGYPNYCPNCGQKLIWKVVDNA